MKTVFLTGGTGFVGSHTAGRFLEEGWRVKALVRALDRRGRLPSGAEVVPGDLLEAQTYQAALHDCDAVVHVAGLVKARSLKEYQAVNSLGAEAVAKAAARACPPGAMFVLVSSQAAAGPAREGRPVTENDPPRPVSWYGRSKLEGELAVERTYPGPWCAVRPSVIYGRGDRGVLQLFTVIQSGWAPILAGGKRRVQVLAVEDLARALVATAARPDLAGRRAFAAGDVVTLRELTMEAAALRRPPARPFPVPAPLIRLGGLIESAREWVTGRTRPFNRDKAREMLQPDWLCDAGPFWRDLGISDLKPWKQGIHDLIRCYVADQWLRQTVWSV